MLFIYSNNNCSCFCLKLPGYTCHCDQLTGALLAVVTVTLNSTDNIDMPADACLYMCQQCSLILFWNVGSGLLLWLWLASMLQPLVVLLRHSCRYMCSLVPRPKEEEEKEPGFSRLRMCLIAVEFHHLRLLLMFSRTLVMPMLVLSVTLPLIYHSIWHAKKKITHHLVAVLKL